MTQKDRVLIVDDEKNIREALRLAFEMEGFDVMAAVDGADGLEKFEAIGADLVVLDLKMPKLGGMEFLKRAHALSPDVPIIILTGHGGVDEAVEAMRRGAFDFMTKPVHLDKLILVAKHAIEDKKMKSREEELLARLDERYNFKNIIGNSDEMKSVLDTVRQVAPTDATVLISGESGTGKEAIAAALHQNSKRKNASFVKVHCAALSESLLESELFGHEKGAFTGAQSRKKGRFELADGGSIFLDEIGEISPAVQVKLLRVLQEREFERVGGEETVQVDVRLITATNRNLEQEVAEGRFREDLFYRLNVVNLHLPPLRERAGDVTLLAQHFLRDFSARYEKEVKGFSAKSLKLLESYNWPGNVRELMNTVEKCVVLSSAEVIEADMLPDSIRNFTGTGEVKLEVGTTLAGAEKRLILSTLDAVGWNKSEAARVLGIGRKTLLRKLDEWGVGSQQAE